MARYRSENITAALNFAKELLVSPDSELLQSHDPLGVCIRKTKVIQTHDKIMYFNAFFTHRLNFLMDNTFYLAFLYVFEF